MINRISATLRPARSSGINWRPLAVAIYHSPKSTTSNSLLDDYSAKERVFSRRAFKSFLALIASALALITLVPRIIYLSGFELEERTFNDQSFQHFEMLEP